MAWTAVAFLFYCNLLCPALLQGGIASQKSCSWLLDINSSSKPRGCCVSLLRQRRQEWTGFCELLPHIYLPTPSQFWQTIENTYLLIRIWIGNDYLSLSRVIKSVDLAASEVSRTPKVSLGWARRCDAWEGRMWAIHPWTGGVNQQAIRHGTNSLVMGGNSQGCGNMAHCN